MTAEAIARLRWCVESADQLKEKYTTPRADDLRTALGRIEALEEEVAAWCDKLRDDERRHVNAHAEALDALERFVPKGKGMGFGGMDATFDRENALAVLAKAGRR